MMDSTTGCIAGIAVAALVSAAPLASAAENPKVDPMQIARGAKAWSNNCGECHDYRGPREFSDKNWDIIVDHMRVIGPLPGGTARDIKAFLKSSN